MMWVSRGYQLKAVQRASPRSRAWRYACLDTLCDLAVDVTRGIEHFRETT